jgi:phosphotransferase system  glucose/maltose/N-acetylglucosamine-specific IIC component
VEFLLKNGDPDPTAAKAPKTLMETYLFSILVMLLFVLSFFAFYYVIENHTTHRPMTLPRMPKNMNARLKPKAGASVQPDL